MTDQTLPLTSIVIPTFNGFRYLEECLASIRRHTPEPHEVIVVDNGSTDETGDYCVRQPDIVYMSLAFNSGFPAACNWGMKVASGQRLLLLNNDVLVTRGWLANMLRCLDSDESVGMVGPVSNYVSGRQQITEPFTHIDDMAERYNRPDSAKWLDTNRLVGLCLLMKREVVERIGLLDERFSPGHYEDDDFCYRARLAGFRLKIAGDVFVYHHGSASFSTQGETAVRELIARNRNLFTEKWGVDPVSLHE